MDAMNITDLRDAYLFAVQKGMTQEAIAKQTGIPVDSLRKFKAGESLGPQRRKTLAEWLEANHLFREARLSDPAIVIAAELRNLADVLESGIDLKTKEKRLASLLDAYGSGRSLRAAEETTKYRG
jgi:transcriptional regulator with XRE-family HTH domain